MLIPPRWGRQEPTLSVVASGVSRADRAGIVALRNMAAMLIARARRADELEDRQSAEARLAPAPGDDPGADDKDPPHRCEACGLVGGHADDCSVHVLLDDIRGLLGKPEPGAAGGGEV